MLIDILGLNFDTVGATDTQINQDIHMRVDENLNTAIIKLNYDNETKTNCELSERIIFLYRFQISLLLPLYFSIGLSIYGARLICINPKATQETNVPNSQDNRNRKSYAISSNLIALVFILLLRICIAMCSERIQKKTVQHMNNPYKHNTYCINIIRFD